MAEEYPSQSRQEAYERAYYEAAGEVPPAPAQPFSDPNAPSSASAEQSFTDYVKTDAFQQAAQAAQNGQQQYYYYTQQAYASPYVRTKDHVAAGLLAIFLGFIGVHKFYLGYNTAGFIMLGTAILGSLFTFGLAGSVMAIIGIIEGIIYLTKNQTAFDAEYVYGHKEWF